MRSGLDSLSASYLSRGQYILGFFVIKEFNVPSLDYWVKRARAGEWDAAGVVLFDGAVENRKGTLVIWFMGNRLNGEADWSGKWVILLGTDELVNLRGEGTWWGPGAPEVGKKGCVDYSGKIHFGSS